MYLTKLMLFIVYHKSRLDTKKEFREKDSLLQMIYQSDILEKRKERKKNYECKEKYSSD